MRSPGVEGPGPELYGSVAQAWLKLATEQPARLIEQQVRFWGQTLRHVAAAQGAFARNLAAPETDTPPDRRFKNPLWTTNPFYSFVMNQYQINAEAIRKAAADLDIPDETDRRRIDWFTRQMIDMLAPTNFLATNPDALERAIETEGETSLLFFGLFVVMLYVATDRLSWLVIGAVMFLPPAVFAARCCQLAGSNAQTSASTTMRTPGL